MASRKVTFALQVKTIATQLADMMDEIDSLAAIYTASGYSSGGSNPIVDADLTGHDITVAQITQFGTLATNLLKFMNNQAPATGQYRSQLDAFRNIS